MAICTIICQIGSVRFFESPCGRGWFALSVDSTCGMEYDSEQYVRGSFHSPLYPDPYPSDVTCHFRFRGAETERVQLIFDDLDLSYTLGDASNAYS